MSQESLLGLEKSWHPIAWSEQLKTDPIAATVLDRDVVAFRDDKGSAVVMDDRCIHKGIKLSTGHCTNGNIVCPYHGWAFNMTGNVVDIPSNIASDALPKRAVKTYTVVEQQGTVWFSFSQQPFSESPPNWHFYDKRSFTTILEMDCEYIRLMENLVDNPHAGFIHGGLLRGQPSSNVTAKIRETEQGVHIQTIGERARRSLLYRLFGEKDREIYHTEEFIAPNIIRTIFSHDGGTHASSQFVCVPVSERKTRVFYRITLDIPFARLAMPFFKRMVDKVLVQDKDILQQEAAFEWQTPDFKRTVVKPDIPSVWSARIARKYAEKGPKVLEKENYKSVDVNYFL